MRLRIPILNKMDVTKILPHEEALQLIADILKSNSVIDPKLYITPGANKGDGFLSHVIRVDAKGTNKDLHVIIKCAPSDKGTRAMMPITLLFEREIVMYDKVFPVFWDLIKETAGLDPLSLLTKCYKCVATEGSERIVMQNIKAAGFDVWDRREQMSEVQVKFVLEQYGKFHGLSYALKDQRPQQYESLVESMGNTWRVLWGRANMKENFGYRLEYIKKVISSIGCEKLQETFQAYSKKAINYFVNERAKGKFTVISHGDCWCNNMMFKFEDRSNPKKPSDMKLIDFQLSDDTPPMYDLAYFLYVSAPKSVLDNLDDFLKIYYDSLTSFTKLLGTDVSKYLTLEEMMEQWKIASKFAYNLFLHIVKVMYQEDSEAVDLQDISEGKITIKEHNERTMINEDIIRRRICELTLHMYNRGFLMD